MKMERISSGFSLSQNYPNPFKPSTKICFRIPLLGGDERGGFVTLKVYDVLGNEVATLIEEYKQSGSHEVEFNSHSGEVRNPSAGRQGLTSRQGSALSSGIYFYQLKVYPANSGAESFIQTKKMLLLR